ncbi:MAG: hypothetical protein QOC89_5780 [Paraburkholderia sp.]|jgi:hypothetical protein|nr:hypothetical protein [Paraburkholderia sp.]
MPIVHSEHGFLHGSDQLLRLFISRAEARFVREAEPTLRASGLPFFA